MSGSPPLSVSVRPLDPNTETAYVYSTATKTTASFFGGRYAHWETISRAVTDILKACRITVATIDPEPEIMGYVATGATGHIEFIYLRRSIADESRIKSIHYQMRRATEVNDRGALDAAQERLQAELRVAMAVMAKLLPTRAAVLRRAPKHWVLDAASLAGCAVTVVPGPGAV